MSHANYDVLTLIIDNVVDVGTLFALLTVSKQTFYWACRALYRDPAFFLQSQGGPRQRATTAFIQLVLAISPANDRDTNKLRQVFCVQQTSCPPMLNYLSLIRVARWEGVIHRCTVRRWDELKDSFHSQPHVSQCFTEAACYHQLDNIVELEILSTAIENFVDKASILSKLRRIVIAWPSYLKVEDLHHSTIRLVKAIQLYHGQGSLHDCQLSMNIVMKGDDQSYPLFHELNTLLPPPGALSRLLAGSSQPLDRYLFHLDRVAVSPYAWPEISKQYPHLTSGQILQRCRELRELTITRTPDSQLLAWAAREARDRASGSLLVPAVPLKELYVHGDTLSEQVVSNVVKDGLFGFAASLCELNVEFRRQVEEPASSMEKNEEDGPFIAHLVGVETLRLPRLRFIHFVVSIPKLFDSRLIQISPNLKYLSVFMDCLCDPGSPYQTWPLLHCPTLISLILGGAAIFAFDPASLASMTRLGRLNLSQKENPTPNALSRMKRWTWEWKLPNLEELSVRCTMDGWFSPKILRGCPRLKTLKLTTTCQSLLAVCSALESPCFKPLKCVEKVTIRGRWDIAPKDIHYLVRRVFPRMKYLRLSEMSPRVGRDMIMATRRHPTLAIVELLDSINHQEIEKMGLIQRNTGRVQTERDSEHRSERQEVEEEKEEYENENEEEGMRAPCLYQFGERNIDYQWQR